MKKTSLSLVLLVVLLLVAGLMGVAPAQAAPSPNTIIKWADPLPVPPVAQKIFKPGVSAWADYYEIDMRASQHRFNAGLGEATVWTYAQPGQAPVLLGPTIVAQSGRPIVVKWINNLPNDIADFPLKDSIDDTIPGAPGLDVPVGAAIPHLHGGHSAARYDGTPMQWWTKDHAQTGDDYVTDTFTYVNDQPASLSWYHDHTMGATRFKPYLGLAAAYLIFDKVDNGTTINGQKVPSGYGKYHLPLVIQDKQFNSNGTLFYPTAADGGGSGTHPIWVPEFFGDTPVINGKAYPFLNAEPRRYRLRLLNGSQARFYGLQLKVGETPAAGKADTRPSVPLWVIGSEGGLLPAPVKMDRLLIAPGERFDVIVDFAGLRGRTVMMTNDANAPYPDGTPADAPSVPELMKIKVNQPLIGTDTTVKPANLKLPAIPRLVATPGIPPRDVVAKETMDTATDSPDVVLLNGYNYMEPTTDFVKLGTTETWRWINLTGDAHPMHMHLVTFQVVNRQAFDVDAYTADWDAYLASERKTAKPRLANYLGANPKIPPAPEEMGYKDTVKAPPGYVTRVRAKFTLPWTAQADYDPKTRSFGNWVYHCHILEHEENDMMRPFEVVK